MAFAVAKRFKIHNFADVSDFSQLIPFWPKEKVWFNF